jgi:hypothetical protein
MPVRIAFVLVLTAGLSSAAPVLKVALTTEQEAEFNALWDKSYRSLESRAQLYCRLVQQPDAAVAYITRTVKPAKLDEKEAKALITALDSKVEATWKRAYRDLRLRDVRLAMTLDEAWAEAKTEEQKLRLGYLLMGSGNYEDEAKSIELQPPTKPGSPGRLFMVNKNRHYGNNGCDALQTFEEWMTPKRKDWRPEIDPRIGVALSALERIGTKAARDHLRDLASGGHPKAWTTTEALAAVDRLNAPRPDTIPMADLWVLPWYKLTEVASVNQFLDRPKEAVKFFGKNLRPVKLTADGAKKLLAKLFSDDLDEMRAALREIDLIDFRLVMTLEDAWKEAKTAAHRCRLVAAMQTWSRQPKRTISDDYDPDERDRFYDYTFIEDTRFGHWSINRIWREDVPLEERKRILAPGGGYFYGKTAGEITRDRWYRENTAIHILDAIGTDDALKIIQDMAIGHPDAGPTKAAAEVLKRRKK